MNESRKNTKYNEDDEVDSERREREILYEMVFYPNLDPGLHIPLVSDITSREGGRKSREIRGEQGE